jgi:rhodanese-related sulfurtransferase
MSYQELSVAEVKARLAGEAPVRLIDVREPYEHAIARIEGAELLPLSEARNWVETLPRDQELIFFCHHGSRSAQIAGFLAARLGFTNVANMLGGIDDWSLRIDSAIPRY